VHAPPFPSSAGEEAVELAAMAGLHLDDWQADTLTLALGERKTPKNPETDGKWASFEVGVMVSRQNGKGALIEARSLAGLFLLGERLIVHTAHQFDTSLEAFRRLLFLIEDTPDLDQQVQRVSRSHGEEGIELKGGQRIRFRTRTKGGGRGFSGDCVFLDEAMILPEETRGALMPTLSARPNPQLWYLGSAVDQQIHEHGRAFARIRARGREGKDPRLTWVEFCADAANPDEVTTSMAQDPDAWDAANPSTASGRIQHEYIEAEQRSLAPRTFAVERLGVGDWPDLDVSDGDAITREAWEACQDRSSVLADPVRIAFDVRPDGSWSSICAAGMNEHGEPHVELVERRQGSAWLPTRLAELQRTHKTGPVLLAARSTAGASVPALDRLGVRHEAIDATEFGQACVTFLEAIRERTVRHKGQAAMQASALGAKQRPSGDSLVWTRRGSAVDISPICAATIAHHAVTSGAKRSVYEDRDMDVW
jgi:hypothetical protein